LTLPILADLSPEGLCFLALTTDRKRMMAKKDGNQSLQRFGLGV
jgi:hypothetical protein